MNVRFTSRAESDLANIVDFLTAHSPEAAGTVAASLQESVRVIAGRPFGGRKTKRPTIFVKIVPRYRLREDAIEILHIRHAARRPWIA